jgi:hypothetical protein
VTELQPRHSTPDRSQCDFMHHTTSPCQQSAPGRIPGLVKYGIRYNVIRHDLDQITMAIHHNNHNNAVNRAHLEKYLSFSSRRAARVHGTCKFRGPSASHHKLEHQAQPSNRITAPDQNITPPQYCCQKVHTWNRYRASFSSQKAAPLVGAVPRLT